MFEFLTHLFDTSDFPPRWYCGDWTAGHGWLHILSDLGVWAAYLAIPCVLGYFVLRRRDIPFRGMFLLFGAFILACGATHLMEALIFWWPAYRLAGVIKLLTAIVSWATVIALVPVVPKVLAMRSPEELEREIGARRAAETALQRTNFELERQVAELRASEERFRLLVDGTKDHAVFMLDPTGRVISWNPGAERIKQYRAEEIVNQHFSRFYPDEDISAGKPGHELEVAVATGRYEDEGWRLRKDGSRFWANVVLTALWDQDGNLKGFSKITRDMTERKQAEENARRLLEEATARRAAEEHAAVVWEQRERLRVTLDSIGDAVIAIDTDGRVTLMNPVAQTLTGWGAEAVNRPLEDVFHIINQQTRLPVESPVGRVLREGKAVGLANHTVLIGKDGTERLIDDSASPIKSEQGETLGAVLVFRDVTEKGAAENALRTSAERLMLALEAGRMGVWELNLLTNAVWWSDNLEPILGLEPGTFEGTLEAFQGLVHPDDRGFVSRTMSRAVDTRSAYDIEFRSVWPDRSVHWIAAKGNVFCDDNGQPVRIMGVGTDVTDQKRAEQELRDAERRFKAVFNQQFQFMAILAPDGTVLDANDICFQATGVDRCQVLGRPYWEAPWYDTRPEMQQWWQDHINEVVTGSGPVAGEVDYFQADGSIRHAEVVVTGLKDDGARVMNLIIEGRDITERKQQESALRASEERWRTLTEALPNLVWTDLPDGQCDWLSSQWGKYTGIPENELLGLRWLETVLHPADRERTLACWTAACADQGDYDLEYRIRRYDGEYHWFKTRGVPIRDEQGKIVYWFGTCTDIEDYKRLEAALREADRRKNEFLAILAHELRNPLAPIRNGLQILRLADEREIRDQTREMMERQLGQMVRLVDDLLDISRISQNKLELRKARIALASVVENAVETARPLIEAKGHTLSVTLPPHAVYLDADLTRLAQVVWNLLNNSAKYTDPGGLIELIAQDDGRHVTLRVRDNGIGIPAEHQPRLFEIFSQVDHGIERSQGGLGIGLALVKGLIEMHGGSVEIRSAGVGKGSEFVVCLPLAQSEHHGEKTPSGEWTAISPGRRVLVVDDNRDAASSLVMMLSLLGHDTRMAHDGLEAVELAEAFRPDVVLLDIGLPKLNGYDACRRIRQKSWGQGVVIIAATGWGQEEDRRRSQEAGFSYHLVKPVDPAALVKLIGSINSASRQ